MPRAGSAIPTRCPGRGSRGSGAPRRTTRSGPSGGGCAAVRGRRISPWADSAWRGGCGGTAAIPDPVRGGTRRPAVRRPSAVRRRLAVRRPLAGRRRLSVRRRLALRRRALCPADSSRAAVSARCWTPPRARPAMPAGRAGTAGAARCSDTAGGTGCAACSWAVPFITPRTPAPKRSPPAGSATGRCGARRPRAGSAAARPGRCRWKARRSRRCWARTAAGRAGWRAWRCRSPRAPARTATRN